MAKIKIDVLRLFAASMPGAVTNASIKMDITVIGDDGNAIGTARAEFDGKVTYSTYTREYDLVPVEDLSQA